MRVECKYIYIFLFFFVEFLSHSLVSTDQCDGCWNDSRTYPNVGANNGGNAAYNGHDPDDYGGADGHVGGATAAACGNAEEIGIK